MRIVADAGIPLLNEHYLQWGELRRLPGRDISRADLLDADALIVRSITQVNAELLADTKVRFVGSATSGVDHIDQAYLRDANVEFAHAAGCNADAVADYVCSALAALGVDLGRAAGLKVAVVGLGQVGSRLAGRLHNLGFEIKAYDPFLTSSQSKFISTWDAAMGCDIISLHVPLTHAGDYPTYHLLAAEQLAALPEQLILINAARGAVIDNTALAAILPQRPAWRTVLDVWEGEPAPNASLLQQVNIATPHIAGHSLQAKIRGASMVYQAFLNCFFAEQFAAQQDRQAVETLSTPTLTLSAGSNLNDVVLAAYNVCDDTEPLVALAGNADISQEFERLRKHYRVRHEFAAYNVAGKINSEVRLKKQLKILNFNV